MTFLVQTGMILGGRYEILEHIGSGGMDHLDGILYGERASEPYRDLEEEEEWEEE